MRPIAFVLFCAVVPAFAQEHPYPHAGKVDAAIKAEVDRLGIVGLAAVVIDGGEIAWMKGYGYADRENKVPVDPAATQFRWASISKPVTAVAALQLVEEGQLDLDADIRFYVPEFPDKGARITARDLLRHRGGIVHYANGEVVRTEKVYAEPHPFADVIKALDTFKDSPLIAPPGRKFSYSTHGYILLSAVVERAGKVRFADQVQARIAGPLGMANFRPDYQWEEIPGRAVGYSREGEKMDGEIVRRPAAEDEDVSWKLGGGFTSPATDLARFGVGLIGRKLVSEETEKLMWTVNKPADPDGAKPYGLGFFVIDRPDGTKWVGHDGSQAKARTCLMLDPAGKRGVALMSNSEWAKDLVELAMALLGEISKPAL